MTRKEAIEYIKEWLKDEYALNGKDKIVLTMAIEALSNADQQVQHVGCVDLINRQDAINAIENTDAELTEKDWDELTDAINALPSADKKQVTGKLNNRDDSLLTADSEAVKERKSKLDLISRQDIKYHVQLEAMGNGQYEDVEIAYRSDVESLPSVETQTVSEKHQLSEETPTNTPTDLIGRQDVLNMIIVAGECEPDLGYTHLHKVVENIPSAEPKTGRWIDYSDEGYVECPFCHSATTCDGNKDELHFCFSCGARMLGGVRKNDKARVANRMAKSILPNVCEQR